MGAECWIRYGNNGWMPSQLFEPAFNALGDDYFLGSSMSLSSSLESAIAIGLHSCFDGWDEIIEWVIRRANY